MHKRVIICSKCEGAMDIGIIADNTYGGQLQSRWLEGEAKESFWTGLKTDGTAEFKIVTYRCGNCGYLESYALDEAQKKSIFE